MSTQLSVWTQPTSATGLEKLAQSMRHRVAMALPSFLAGQEERLMMAMITETRKNPALLECTPASLFGAVIQAGQLGLTIGGPLGESYILPFQNRKLGAKEASLVPGYKGLIQLAYRSEKLKRLTPGKVRDGEKFVVSRGRNQNLVHLPNRNNTSPVTDYYVEVELTNGGYDFETFTFEEAIAWRDRFSTTRNAPQFVRDNSPWYDMAHGFHQQACKTLIRRIIKRVPLSVDVSRAQHLEDAVEEQRPQELGSMIGDAEAPDGMPTKVEMLRERLEETKTETGRIG